VPGPTSTARSEATEHATAASHPKAIRPSAAKATTRQRPRRVGDTGPLNAASLAKRIGCPSSAGFGKPETSRSGGIAGVTDYHCEGRYWTPHKSYVFISTFESSRARDAWIRMTKTFPWTDPPESVVGAGWAVSGWRDRKIINAAMTEGGTRI
jgi:hypothetical protein